MYAIRSYYEVIMYADKITRSMQATIDGSLYRREKQLKYNADNNITPTALKSKTNTSFAAQATNKTYLDQQDEDIIAADPVVQYMSAETLQKTIEKARTAMKKASRITSYNVCYTKLLRDLFLWVFCL